MTPILAIGRWSGDYFLILRFVVIDELVHAVCVEIGGDLAVIAFGDLRVERPSMEFPIGYAFSRVDAEAVPA